MMRLIFMILGVVFTLVGLIIFAIALITKISLIFAICVPFVIIGLIFSIVSLQEYKVISDAKKYGTQITVNIVDYCLDYSTIYNGRPKILLLGDTEKVKVITDLYDGDVIPTGLISVITWKDKYYLF